MIDPLFQAQERFAEGLNPRTAASMEAIRWVRDGKAQIVVRIAAFVAYFTVLGYHEFSSCAAVQSFR